MTYVEPIAPEDAPDAIDAQVVEGEVGATLALAEVDLYAMQGVEDIQDWLDQLDQAKQDRVQEAGRYAGPYVERILSDLGEAVRDGELGTHDAAAALSWSIARVGLPEVMSLVAGTGGMVALFALYDRAHGYDRAARRHPPKRAAAGRTGAATGRQAAGTTTVTGGSPASQHKSQGAHHGQAHPKPTPRAPLSTPGGVATGSRTAGQRIVAAAEQQVQTHRIEVPGFTGVEADAVSTALALVYSGLTEVIASVADELLRQITAHAVVIDRTVRETRTIRQTVEPKAPVTRRDYLDLLDRVERLQRDLIRTTTEVHRLQHEHQPTTAGRPSPVHPPTEPTPPSYVAELHTLRRVQENHGKAIHDLFAKLGPLVTLAPLVPTLRQMTPQTLAKLQRTATEVETCVVTECPGPHDLQSALRRLLPKLLADAAILAFVEQAITAPERTANLTAPPAEAADAGANALYHAIFGGPGD